MTTLELLRRRADRAFGGVEPDVAMNRLRAIVAPGDFPVGFEGELAKSALAKLKDPDADAPTPRELAALEMMLRMMRPAPKFEDGKLEDLGEPEFLNAFPKWKAFQALLEPIQTSVGRIDTASGEAVGTGFLVADEVLVTNRHVLDTLSRGTRKLDPKQGFIGFRRELHPSVTEAPAPILGVIAVHDRFDIALLRVKPPKRTPLKIAVAAPRLEQTVAAIGHPFDDPVNNPIFTRSIFGNSWGVKRVAPGEVVSSAQSILGHDCSTLGGNSGSPLVSLDNAEVVGLHFGGGFLWRNEAVDCLALSKFVDANG